LPSMIARITGRIERVADGAALIDAGAGMAYEVLVPACDVEPLARRAGQEVVLHTIHYLEGDPSRGSTQPRLVGFVHESDRDFFRLFITVKGIGIRRALRALVRRPGEVAAAIANKDVKFLIALPEIGRRTAEQMVAELSGRVDEFAAEGLAAPAEELPEAAAEALAVLVQLGERRADAAALIQRILAAAPGMDSPERIIQQAYRLKAGGASGTRRT